MLRAHGLHFLGELDELVLGVTWVVFHMDGQDGQDFCEAGSGEFFLILNILSIHV